MYYNRRNGLSYPNEAPITRIGAGGVLERRRLPGQEKVTEQAGIEG
ncbi:hypothetical protein LI010_26180 [Enterocloster aldenensis]|nr:hypothetical protein [Enterocloster aldenensis]